jgi:hypothetical protein
MVAGDFVGFASSFPPFFWVRSVIFIGRCAGLGGIVD